MASEGRVTSTAAIEAILSGLDRSKAVQRVWRRDHTLWRPDPYEIANRLGWLDIIGAMQGESAALALFAREIQAEGYQHVVLLGMGGSSLGPEVLCQTFGTVSGFPRLIVLDSTVPAQLREVSGTIDPSRTLFLVSSKSGGTIETLSFYRYFRHTVEEVLPESAGVNFVAITDAGTPLESLAGQAGFRRVFLNDPDIGGRYSVLSYFGLVPAALAGINVSELLSRANTMRQQCQNADVQSNPGARLAALIVGMAAAGRDKLTIVGSPPIESLGLWIEQLIAESLGKDGKGIIPIAGEPLLGPEAYAEDRLFVWPQVASNTDAATESALQRLETAGHPVERLELRDPYDLGAEFFRWEFAIAVAGAVLGIHPFDQPDVQSSKDITDGVLAGFAKDGRLPEPTGTSGLAELMSQARPGDYLAIMAYLPMTSGMLSLLDVLRRRLMQQYRTATTVGYGPRFLHSTGQMHKGGVDSGLFLQLTMDHQDYDLPIPGQDYSFGTLATAQEIGDLQALSDLGRRTARIDLGPAIISGLRRLVDEAASLNGSYNNIL